jgi:predicted nucleotidyltransferase
MVNIYKLKLTTLQNEILRLLFVNVGNNLNAHQISKILNVSQPAISKALPLLENNRLINIKKDKQTNRLSINLNIENHEVIWLKRTDNLKQIYESGLCQYFYNLLPQTTIILFGSYSFGEDTINSDIDIAIIETNYKEIDLKKFEKILERKIILNFYESFKKIEKHLKNNILNGILLKGDINI